MHPAAREPRLCQQRLELIRDLGYAGPEMQRRLRLLQRRFGLPVS